MIVDISERWVVALESVSAVAGLVDEAGLAGDGVLALAWLADLQVAIRQLDAARVRLVGVVERSGVWAEQGYLSPGSLLRHELRVEHRSARSDLNASRELAELPALAAAFAAGQVSREAVDKIISVGTRNRARHDLLPQFEAIFADVAATQSFAVLVKTLMMWAEQVDPLPIIDAEGRAHTRRYLNLTRVADGWLVEGFLSPEQGAAVAAALNAVVTRTRREPAAIVIDPDVPGPVVTDPDVPASKVPDLDVPDRGLASITAWPQDPSQARADALVDLARLAAASGDLPECGGLTPTVVVTVPLARLQAQCTEPVMSTRSSSTAHAMTPPEVPAWPGLQASGITVSVSNGPGSFQVSAKTAARLTCDCTVHRLVLDPAGLPLDVGRSTRTIPKQIRIALNQRDQGCAYPGCERPPGWCAAHHIEHWARGGETSLQNLILLCDRHHDKIHDGDHVITIEPGRRPVITKPRWPVAA
ncbi:MAG: DUF222 domain-containing protein [Actinomycetes bacterium]